MPKEDRVCKKKKKRCMINFMFTFNYGVIHFTNIDSP